MSNKLDRDFLQVIRKDVTIALGEIAQRHGLKQLELGNITFDPAAGTFRGKLEGMVRGGVSEDAQRYEARRRWTHCKHYPPLGTMMPGDKSMAITGMTRGGKIVLTDPAGKEYTLRLAAFDRAFPMPRESADKLFANGKSGARS